MKNRDFYRRLFAVFPFIVEIYLLFPIVKYFIVHENYLVFLFFLRNWRESGIEFRYSFRRCVLNLSRFIALMIYRLPNACTTLCARVCANMYCMGAASLQRRDACITRCSGTLNNAATFDNESACPVSAFVCYGQVDTYTQLGKRVKERNMLRIAMRSHMKKKKKSRVTSLKIISSLIFLNSWDVSVPVYLLTSREIHLHSLSFVPFFHFCVTIWWIRILYV